MYYRRVYENSTALGVAVLPLHPLPSLQWRFIEFVKSWRRSRAPLSVSWIKERGRPIIESAIFISSIALFRVLYLLPASIFCRQPPPPLRHAQRYGVAPNIIMAQSIYIGVIIEELVLRYPNWCGRFPALIVVYLIEFSCTCKLYCCVSLLSRVLWHKIWERKKKWRYWDYLKWSRLMCEAPIVLCHPSVN